MQCVRLIFVFMHGGVSPLLFISKDKSMSLNMSHFSYVIILF